MKRALIGGFLSLLGTIWGLAVIIFAGNNLVDSWATPPGRFLTTLAETGLIVPFVIAGVMFLGGIAIMAVEVFRKD